MAITDLGRVTPVLKGAYNAGTAYVKLDIVTYGGGSYICKAASTANLPTNTTYWQLLAEAGDYAGTAEAMVGINLLHNYDFRTPVNQRAVSGVISGAGYFFDRWLLNSGTVTPATGYLTMANATEIEQRIEGLNLGGVECTVSVMIAGAVIEATETFPSSAGTVGLTLTGFGTATLGYHADYMFIRFTSDAARNVQMVKCEKGTVSTLDRQPPVDYGAELLKCQRFYRRVDSANGVSAYFYGRTGFAASGQFTLIIPGPQMRLNPTFVRDNAFAIAYGGVFYSAETVTNVVSTMYGIAITGTCSTAVPKLVPIVAWANNIVEFSADL